MSSNRLWGKTCARSKEGTSPTLPVANTAPNVLWILLDDGWFDANSAFVGPCQTPNIEKLGANRLSPKNSSTSSWRSNKISLQGEKQIKYCDQFSILRMVVYE